MPLHLSPTLHGEQRGNVYIHVLTVCRNKETKCNWVHMYADLVGSPWNKIALIDAQIADDPQEER